MYLVVACDIRMQGLRCLTITNEQNSVSVSSSALDRVSDCETQEQQQPRRKYASLISLALADLLSSALDVRQSVSRKEHR